MGLVETKLNESDNIEWKDFVIKRVDRDEEGGGVLIAFKKSLTNIMMTIKEYRNHDCEMLWMKLDNGKIKIRIGVIYMPQESRTLLKELKVVYEAIEEQIKIAKDKGEKILLMGDFNCKIGTVIEGNREDITKGGRLLLKLTAKHNLAILNSKSCCEGLWTRRQDGNASVIDYLIVQENDVDLVSTMNIDEEKSRTPYTMETHKDEIRRVYTDHNAITCTMNWNAEADGVQKHIFKLDKKKFKMFEKELEVQKVSEEIGEGPIRKVYTKWNKRVKEIRNKYSSRRKAKRKWKVDRILSKEESEIKKQLKKKNSKEEVKKLKLRKRVIQQLIDKEHIKKKWAHINGVVKKVKEAGGVNSTTFWEVRKELLGRKAETAEAMEDEDGVIHEDKEKIKQIYAEHYKKLLQRPKSNTKTGKETEETIDLVSKGIEVAAALSEPQKNNIEDIEKIVNNLDTKKATDSDSWNYEMVKAGGKEMSRSLLKIYDKIDEELDIPNEWEHMEIRSKHKKGNKKKMPNQRGLFLTHSVSKIYEKVVKERNNETFTENITEWATGGVRKRAPIDNVMMVTSVIERNTYLKKNTYITFTDAEKCFDKLWLEDGINELWRCGTNIRDCQIIKKMNEVAKIVIKTPLGPTEEITVENIVRQGTVYGPQICIASMDKVNLIGDDIVTHYGPDLQIRAVAFIDDVTGAGGITTANNTISNCNILEDKKMMTFNNKDGKTEYVVIQKEDDIMTVTAEVKRGRIERVPEHRMLGTWFDETGEYMINIQKKKQKLQFMIATAKEVGSPKNVGILTVETRLKLGEAVILQSILYNIEAFPNLTEKEITELDRVQGTMLRQFLEVPSATPYYGLLMETGWWTMEARVDYRKLMLFHNILNSDNKRTIKRIILIQKRENREGTWYTSVKKILTKYNINTSATSTLKSKWKEEVKRKIKGHQNSLIKKYCHEHTKTRTVKEDEHELKSYLKENPVAISKSIVKYRLHMNNFPMNFKGKWSQTTCPLCNTADATTEHYLECKITRRLREIWEVDGKSDESGKKMADVARYFNNVETLLGPKSIRLTKQHKDKKIE